MASLKTKHYAFASCPECDGVEITWLGSLSPVYKTLICEECHHHWLAEGAYACPACNGKGEETCKACDGTGLSRPCQDCGPEEYPREAPYRCVLARGERDVDDSVAWTCRCGTCEGRHWRPWEAR